MAARLPFLYFAAARRCGIGDMFLRDRFSSPVARIALAKSRSEHTIRQPLQRLSDERMMSKAQRHPLVISSERLSLVISSERSESRNLFQKGIGEVAEHRDAVALAGNPHIIISVELLRADHPELSAPGVKPQLEQGDR